MATISKLDPWWAVRNSAGLGQKHSSAAVPPASEHHCCRLCTHPSLMSNIPGQGDLNNVADDNDPNPLFCRLYQILTVGSPA